MRQVAQRLREEVGTYHQPGWPHPLTPGSHRVGSGLSAVEGRSHPRTTKAASRAPHTWGLGMLGTLGGIWAE